MERALEIVSRRIDQIPVPNRDLFDPYACPVSHLPWLAYQLSVDSWNPAWPEAVKRSIIAQSIDIHRRKGTVESVRKVVEAFGAAIALREWWQLDPPGPPHTFDLVLTVNSQNGAPTSARYIEEIIDEIARTKPVRSHFTFTQGLSAEGAIGVTGAARVASFRRLRLAQAA
ncbi:MAG: phage tail protein I [Caulobacteraceae bacterium]|nr:MAG: phage tail protein I [Caulobacteraceae bacterium]